MNLLHYCCPDKAVLCLAANVLLQIAVLAILAWLLASTIARHHPALRHGIWLGALLGILFSPAAAYFAGRAGVSMISLRLLPSPRSAPVDLQRPSDEVAGIKPSSPKLRGAVAPSRPVLPPEFRPAPGLGPQENRVSPAAPIVTGLPSRAEQPPAAPGDRLPALLGLVVVLWTAGTVVSLARFAFGYLRVVRLQRWLRPATDPRLEAVLAQVRRALNLATLPPLAILPRGTALPGPSTVGIFHPMVILPEDLIELLDTRGLRHVLLHEFAHALRHDALVGLLQRLASAVFWPYPPVHLVNRRLTAAREEICDNYVLRQDEAPDFAETLLAICQRFRGPRLRAGALGLWYRGGKLEHRVTGMLHPRRNIMVRMHRGAMAGTAALFFATVILAAGTRFVEAEPKETPSGSTAAAMNAPAAKKRPLTSTEVPGEKEQAAGKQSASRNRPAAITSGGQQNETVIGTRSQGNCSLAGKVVAEATGQPIARATMYLHYQDTSGSIFVETAADGTFAFNHIPEGPFSLQMINTPGYQATSYNPQGLRGPFPSFSLGAGEHRAGIVLKAKFAYRISGKVLDENGKVPAGANQTRVLAWFKKDGSPQYSNVQTGVDSSTGSYVIDGLGDRPVYVMAINWRAAQQGNAAPPVYYPGTFSRSEAKLLTFGKVRSIENVNITWPRKGGLAVAGTVRDQSGKPIPEAFVVIHHRDMLFDFATAYTDEQGHYEIQGLGDGEFLMHVDAVQRGFIRIREPIKLGRDAKRTQKDFTLSPGVTISGKFVDDAGKPWTIGRSFGSASIVADWGHGFSLTGFRNKYRPKDSEESSGGDFEPGSGPYNEGMMIFPTKSTFLVQGMTPGYTEIHFAPQKEGQSVAKILCQGRDIRESGVDTKPGQQITDITIVIHRAASHAGSQQPAASNPPAAAAAKGPTSGSSVASTTEEGENEASPLDPMERAAFRVPPAERFHLVRSNHTWIGNDGEPLVYDDYDKQCYMSRGDYIVVLSKPAMGFWDFYGARTMQPGSSRVDVSEARPPQDPGSRPASDSLINIVLPGAIDLPAYQLLWQPSVQETLHLTAQQRTKLQEISARYWPARRQIAGKELADTEAAMHKELVEYAAKAHSGIVRSNHLGTPLPFSKELIVKLERQWSDTRKEIEAVFTPEQLRSLKELTFRTFAFGSGLMSEPGTLSRLGVTPAEQDRLRTLQRQLRKEKDRRLRAVTREKAQKMLAVLTGEQLAQLRRQPLSGTTLDDADCSMYPYPQLPSHMPDAGTADELGLTAQQRERVRAIVKAHWQTRIGLQSQEQELKVGDEKGFKAIAQKRQQEMEDLRKKVQEVLTPQQWKRCEEIAWENLAVPLLLSRTREEGPQQAAGLLGLTEQQVSTLRAIEGEYFDKPQQIYCEMTDKALTAFTPQQQEKLRAEVDRLGW